MFLKPLVSFYSIISHAYKVPSSHSRYFSPRSDKHILRVRYDLNGTSSIIPAASVQKASSVKLNLSRALTDQHRESYPKGLVISSDRQWLAMTDNLGRVLLIDGQRERVVRIWKGLTLSDIFSA